MSDIYDVFANNEKIEQKTNLDTKAWGDTKKQQKAYAYETIDKMAMEVVKSPETFKSYLDVQSVFDQYSSGNALLILAQQPNATLIKDSKEWKQQGTYVKKGEHSFVILEPGEQFIKDDGTIGVGYNAKCMFDVSQTNRKQQKPQLLNEEMRLKALLYKIPVNIIPSTSVAKNLLAFYNPKDKTIEIAKGLDADAIFQALSSELAHASMDKGDGSYDRKDSSLRAYCCSYMLSKKLGIDTSNFTFEKFPELFEGLSVKEVRNELINIRDVHAELASRISKGLYKETEKIKVNTQER